MEDLVGHLEEELSEQLSKLSSSDFRDYGLSGLHIIGKPVLIRGLRIDPKKQADTQLRLNRSLSKKPITIALKDGKQLKVTAIDLSITPSSAVYLNDILDGDLI